MVNSVNGCVLSAVVVHPQQSQAVLACTDGSLCVSVYCVCCVHCVCMCLPVCHINILILQLLQCFCCSCGVVVYFLVRIFCATQLQYFSYTQ